MGGLDIIKYLPKTFSCNFFLLDKPELCYAQNSVFPVRLCGCQTIYLDFLSNNWHVFIAFFNRLIAGIWYSIWRCKHKVRRRESQNLWNFYSIEKPGPFQEASRDT